MTDEIPELPGINSQQALSNIMGNTKIYRKILIKFRDHYDDKIEHDFRAAQADNDQEAAFRYAHSLKGVAATVGAEGVQVAAKNLEHACNEFKSAEEIDKLLAELISAMNLILPALRSLGNLA